MTDKIKNDKARIKCPECGGKGYYEHTVDNHHMAGVCRYCYGSGSIELELTSGKPSDDHLYNIFSPKYTIYNLVKVLSDDMPSMIKTFFETMTVDVNDRGIRTAKVINSHPIIGKIKSWIQKCNKANIVPTVNVIVFDVNFSYDILDCHLYTNCGLQICSSLDNPNMTEIYLVTSAMYQVSLSKIRTVLLKSSIDELFKDTRLDIHGSRTVVVTLPEFHLPEFIQNNLESLPIHNLVVENNIHSREASLIYQSIDYALHGTIESCVTGGAKPRFSMVAITVNNQNEIASADLLKNCKIVTKKMRAIEVTSNEINSIEREKIENLIVKTALKNMIGKREF